MAVTWTTPALVAALLGPTAAGDDARLVSVCAAANATAYRYASAAGLADADNPGDDVIEGTTLYAATLYKQRGAVDGFPSFDEQAVAVPASTFAQCKRLWGYPAMAIG